MDQFLVDNASRYQSLVSAFKPTAKTGQGKGNTTSNPDMVVSTRIRPILEDESSSGLIPGVFARNDEDGVVDIHELRKTVKGQPALNSGTFQVDRAFGPDDSTEQVFQAVVEPLVPWAWGGGVGIMFAYGQTGSGKTFTVSGLERLVAELLFDGDLEGTRKIMVCIVELAGNSACDLLNSRKPISILEDSFGTTQLAGALELHITSKSTLLNAIEEATSFRRTASTKKNDTSSRSHAIYRIRIENPTIPSVEDGFLYLIDLAGSEAARDVTSHTADRMRETREINTSLSVLKDCIRGRAALDPLSVVGKSSASSKKQLHIPFRQSALTKVLKPVFDPAGLRSCKTVVLACVNPCLADVAASKNTLRYAEMLRVVAPRAKALEYDSQSPATWSNEQARQWIDKNSGTPAISSATVAPFESGVQLLRLPAPEFLTRCLKTAGVSPEHAAAFRSKLWQMHVDSQRPRPRGQGGRADDSTGGGAKSAPPRLVEILSSSQDPEPSSSDVPFKQRIRPGMVVRWVPQGGFQMRTQGGPNMAVVLCPQSAAGAAARNFQGELVNTDGATSGEGGGKTEPQSYLCALVLPSVLPEAYELSLWRQAVVDVEAMEAEVLLEYDVATRYYFMKV